MGALTFTIFVVFSIVELAIGIGLGCMIMAWRRRKEPAPAAHWEELRAQFLQLAREVGRDNHRGGAVNDDLDQTPWSDSKDGPEDSLASRLLDSNRAFQEQLENFRRQLEARTSSLQAPTAQPGAGGPSQAPTQVFAFAERRRYERRKVSSTQRVAPYVPGRPLEFAGFREVQCENLSESGVAFLADVPQPEWLVVELGKAPNLIYMRAKVVRCSPIHTPLGTVFSVGCEFRGRLAE